MFIIANRNNGILYRINFINYFDHQKLKSELQTMKVCRCGIFILIFILNIILNHVQGKEPTILHAVAILPRIDLSIGNEHIFSKRSVSLSADSNWYHIIVFIKKKLRSSSINKDKPKELF